MSLLHTSLFEVQKELQAMTIIILDLQFNVMEEKASSGPYTHEHTQLTLITVIKKIKYICENTCGVL